MGGAGNQRDIKWFIKPGTKWKLFHSPEKRVVEKGAMTLFSVISFTTPITDKESVKNTLKKAIHGLFNNGEKDMFKEGVMCGAMAKENLQESKTRPKRRRNREAAAGYYAPFHYAICADL